MRTALAFFVAWLVPIALGCAVALAQMAVDSGFLWLPVFSRFLEMVALFSGIASAAVLIVFGFPIHVYLAAQKIVSWRAYVLWGTAPSFVVATIFVLANVAHLYSSEMTLTGAILLCGPLAASAFWQVLRPDLQSQILIDGVF